LFLLEAGSKERPGSDVREVANYVRAIELGLTMLNDLPLSTRLVNATHAELLAGVRGGDKRPGELRTRQVWIGSEGTTLVDARFVPPPADLIPDLMHDWASFVNEDLELPPLVQCAMMHYQFEAIHPFIDGNGRIGRLLITLFLCAKGILRTPLLYLSAFFDRNRDEYYERLYRVSADGHWDAWLQFFLRGVEEQATDALLRSRRVRQVHEDYRHLLQERRESANALRLLDQLFVNPFITTPTASKLLGLTSAGAGRIIERLVSAGILTYAAGNWPRVFVARGLLEAIESPVN
jgi:Fic family protein